MTITESCPCGATFTVANDWAPYAERAATAWRTEHRHVEPVPLRPAAPARVRIPLARRRA